jgi:hypothetical protein
MGVERDDGIMGAVSRTESVTVSWFMSTVGKESKILSTVYDFTRKRIHRKKRRAIMKEIRSSLRATKIYLPKEERFGSIDTTPSPLSIARNTKNPVFQSLLLVYDNISRVSSSSYTIVRAGHTSSLRVLIYKMILKSFKLWTMTRIYVSIQS